LLVATFKHTHVRYGLGLHGECVEIIIYSIMEKARIMSGINSTSVSLGMGDSYNFICASTV